MNIWSSHERKGGGGSQRAFLIGLESYQTNSLAFANILFLFSSRASIIEIELINILTCEISPMSCMNTLLHIITKFITKINLQINSVAARTKYLFSPSVLTHWQLNGNTVIWMQLSDCWKRQQWILLNQLSRFSIVAGKEITAHLAFLVFACCCCLVWNMPDPRWDDKSEIMKASVVQYCVYKSQRSWQFYLETMHLCLVTCNISMW